MLPTVKNYIAQQKIHHANNMWEPYLERVEDE